MTATAAGDLTASAPSQPVGPVVFVRRVRVTVDFNGNDDEFINDESFDPPPRAPEGN